MEGSAWKPAALMTVANYRRMPPEEVGVVSQLHIMEVQVVWPDLSKGLGANDDVRMQQIGKRRAEVIGVQGGVDVAFPGKAVMGLLDANSEARATMPVNLHL